MSRAIERQGFDQATRLSLVETDLDRQDAAIVGLTDEIKKLRLSVTAFFVSLGTSSVLLAINLVVMTR